jgi:heme A synthase
LWTIAAPIFAMFVVGVSGAVTALGDTLFPSASIATGLARDLAHDSSWLVRLRALHPLFAVGTAALIVTGGTAIRSLRPSRAVAKVSRVAALLAIAQVAAGLLDVATLAAVWVQLVHLVLAYGVWIALVLTGAAALSSDPLRPPSPAPRDVPVRQGERADAA